MAQINEYPTANPIQASDLLALFSTGNSDTRKASISALQAYLQDNLTFNDGKEAFTTQYSAPSATGFSVQITDGANNIWLVLTPDATYATGTIILPTSTNATDKQEVLVNCTEIVTTLTINGNGATVVGGPTTLAANDSFKLKFDATLSRWYKVA
jgi:hypothetical protein